MAKINKQEIIQKLIDELNLYPGKDVIPSELADKILAVYQINTEEITVKVPPATIVRDIKQLSATTATMYTTSSSSKFYLTNVFLAMTTAVATTGEGYITITVDGTTRNIVYLDIRTTAEITSTNPVIVLNLQNPIIIDKGTNITLTTSSGTVDATATIIGYEE